MKPNNTYKDTFYQKKFNKYELINLLYEKLLSNFKIIENSIMDNNIELKLKYINNSIDILNELINSLNFKEGDIAYYLYGIYNDLNRRLILVNSNNDINNLDIVKNNIKELYQLWKEETK